MWMPFMLALVGQPSLHGYYACMVYWNQGAPRRNCRQKQNKTSFSPFLVFLFSRNPTKRFWGLSLWHFWAGRARHPGPPSQPQHVSLEFHNVGGWLTHGDLALGAGVDFLAVAEHRLIPARVRSGLGSGVEVFLLFGLLLRKILLMQIHKTAYKYLGICICFKMWEPYMLASVRQPSLHGYYACMVYWTKGALRSNRAERVQFDGRLERPHVEVVLLELMPAGELGR